MTTSTLTALTPACVAAAELFQHPLLEESTASSPRERARQQSLQARAEQVCNGCPLMTQCLYQAVVGHDVAGFVAGSTEAQRRSMRRVLGVRVESEDLSAWAGTREANRRVTTDEVRQLRAAHPDDSLPELAIRLGCSLSTIKRHLKAHRAETEVGRPRLQSARPSLDAVLAAFRRVVGPAAQRLAA